MILIVIENIIGNVDVSVTKNESHMNYQNEKINERESPNKNHKEIPGNPSTATSSALKLNDRSNGKPLRVLTEEDWSFWIHNGYIVIRNAVSKEQARKTADFIWEPCP